MIELPEEMNKKIHEIRNSSLTLLKEWEEKDNSERLLELIADYGAIKLELAEQEYHLENLEVNYKQEVELLKTKLMNETGLKATPAKAQAEQSMKEHKLAIMETSYHISLLKTSVHILEYQIRLKFIQLQEGLKNEATMQDL